MKTKFTKTKLYKILAYLTIIILAIGFTFPLYWIITGSFKTPQAINATTPQWFPQEWTLANYEKLFSRQVAPLWEIHVPFTDIVFAGPEVPAAIRWMGNTIFMAVVAMLLTCITAAMAGYALAKKTLCGTYHYLYTDRMRNGASETGYPDSADPRNVVAESV